MKDLKRSHKAKELDNLERKRPPKISHFRFEGRQGDFAVEDMISIPLCGDMHQSPIATNKPAHVSCHQCLVRLKEIAAKDSYPQALAHVKTYAPVLFAPDMKIVKMGKHSGEPREVVNKHMNAHRLMQSKFLTSVDDIPGNMIGSSKETFYRAMMVSRLVITKEDAEDINGDALDGVVVGEYNPDTADKIDELLEIFKP